MDDGIAPQSPPTDRPTDRAHLSAAQNGRSFLSSAFASPARIEEKDPSRCERCARERERRSIDWTSGYLNGTEKIPGTNAKLRDCNIPEGELEFRTDERTIGNSRRALEITARTSIVQRRSFKLPRFRSFSTNH